MPLAIAGEIAILLQRLLLDSPPIIYDFVYILNGAIRRKDRFTQ